MRKCHNRIFIVKTNGGDVSSLNGKREIPNKAMANTTRAFLLNSSHKKELGFIVYKYAIYISRGSEKRVE